MSKDAVVRKFCMNRDPERGDLNRLFFHGYYFAWDTLERDVEYVEQYDVRGDDWDLVVDQVVAEFRAGLRAGIANSRSIEYPPDWPDASADERRRLEE